MSNNKWLESLSEDARKLYRSKLNERRRIRYSTDVPTWVAAVQTLVVLLLTQMVLVVVRIQDAYRSIT
jgi:hypothetical protein